MSCSFRGRIAGPKGLVNPRKLATAWAGVPIHPPPSRRLGREGTGLPLPRREPERAPATPPTAAWAGSPQGRVPAGPSTFFSLQVGREGGSESERLGQARPGPLPTQLLPDRRRARALASTPAPAVRPDTAPRTRPRSHPPAPPRVPRPRPRCGGRAAQGKPRRGAPAPTPPHPPAPRGLPSGAPRPARAAGGGPTWPGARGLGTRAAGADRRPAASRSGRSGGHSPPRPARRGLIHAPAPAPPAAPAPAPACPGSTWGRGGPTPPRPHSAAPAPRRRRPRAPTPARRPRDPAGPGPNGPATPGARRSTEGSRAPSLTPDPRPGSRGDSEVPAPSLGNGPARREGRGFWPRR